MMNPQEYTHDNIRSIYLDSMVTISEFSDQSCPVIIKMTEYTINKRGEIQWYSDSFYTHNKGYKMCLVVVTGGDGKGKGTHLSVFLALMKGPHDDELIWPLKEEFEITLLNQISDSESYTKRIIYEDKFNAAAQNKVLGWGNPQFISNDTLYKATPTCQYLKDDCLFFQVAKL